MIKSIQNSLRALYYSLGGSAENVRNTDDVDALICAIAALGIGNSIKAAVELPALPTDDGTYTLKLVMDDGAATFTWEAVSAE